MTAAVLETLAAIVGPAHLLRDGDLSAWEVDWRKRYRGRALAVARPGSTAEVAAVLRACTSARRRGRAAGRQHRSRRRLGARRERDPAAAEPGAAEPRARDRRAEPDADGRGRLRAADRAGGGRRAGPAVPFRSPPRAAARLAATWRPTPAGRRCCATATRASCASARGGDAVRRGLDGLSGLRKDNTGYALRDLYIGSEGTLGVITAATLKLCRSPRRGRRRWPPCADLAAATDCCNWRRPPRPRPDRLRGDGRLRLVLVGRHFPQLRRCPLARSGCPGPCCCSSSPTARARATRARVRGSA